MKAELCEAGVQTDSYYAPLSGEIAGKVNAEESYDAEVLDVTDKGVQVKYGHDSSEAEVSIQDVLVAASRSSGRG